MSLTEDGIIGARDSWGRTPIIIGKKEGAYAASSATTSFPNLDYETAYEVGPGEIVKITADGMEQILSLIHILFRLRSWRIRHFSFRYS